MIELYNSKRRRIWWSLTTGRKRKEEEGGVLSLGKREKGKKRVESI